MKYLLLTFVALPLVASCTMVQENYHSPDYYAPSSAGVEVHHYPPQQSRYHHYEGRDQTARRIHSHNHGHGSNGSAVIVTPHKPTQAQTNVHNHHNVRPIGPGKSVIRNQNHGHQIDTQKKQHITEPKVAKVID